MNITQALNNFIESEKPESIILKGRWGVGKTYFWKSFIISNCKKLKKKNYSYVSLFGLNNIDDLKFAIFENIISKDVLNKKKHKSSLFKSLLKNVPTEFKIPFVTKITLPVEKIAFSSVSDSLICFDDLERLNDNFSFNEVLGLANYLKEEKKCSILFIANDNQIDKSKPNQSFFYKYNEKTIDREVVLKRSLKETVDIIFESHDLYDYIFPNIKLLNISNLRILQRIDFFLTQFYQSIDIELERQTIEELIKKIILFTWIKYETDQIIPDIGFLKKYRRGLLGITLTPSSENHNENEDKWRPIIQKYGFSAFTDFDEIIWNYIDQGIIEPKKFKNEIEKRNQIFFKENKHQLLNKAWDLYSNSFHDNGDRFSQELTNSVIENIKTNSINLGEINSAYEMILELGEKELADSILNSYKPHIKDKNKKEILSSVRYLRTKIHDDLMSIIESTAETDDEKMSFEEVLRPVIYENGWGGDVTAFLLRKTEDDFFNFFSSIESDDLHSYIEFCLRLGESSNSSKENLEISQKMKSVLKRISSMNKLNEIRIKSIYGTRIN